jgi:hypothetical protein
LSGGNIARNLERFDDVFRRELWRKVSDNECSALDTADSWSVSEQIYKGRSHRTHANTRLFCWEGYRRRPPNGLLSKKS